MNAFLERSLKKQVGVARLPVEFRAETVDRNNGNVLSLVGIAEDESVRRLVEIEIRDRQQHRIRIRMRALHSGGQRSNEQLPPRRVERAARHDQRTLHTHAGEKPLLQTGSEAIQE